MSQRSYLSSRHWSAEFLTRRTSGIFNEWDRNFVSSQQVKTFFGNGGKLGFPFGTIFHNQLTCIWSKWVGEPDYCALTRTRPKASMSLGMICALLKSFGCKPLWRNLCPHSWVTSRTYFLIIGHIFNLTQSSNSFLSFLSMLSIIGLLLSSKSPFESNTQRWMKSACVKSEESFVPFWSYDTAPPSLRKKER